MPAAAALLRERLHGPRPLLGTFLSLGSAAAAEACAVAGLDWLVADLEHGAGGEAELLGQVHAAAAHGVPVVARVESAARIRVGRALDLGAAGAMLPRLESRAEVVAAIAHVRYPPAGDRGVAAFHPAGGWGLRPPARGDAAPLALVQIETAGALEEVEAIAATPGVDVLFVGPRDLTQALGCPGELDAPAFRAALARVRSAAHAAGVVAGVLAPDLPRARAYAAEGFGFVGVASDAAFVARAARAAAEAADGLVRSSCPGSSGSSGPASA